MCRHRGISSGKRTRFHDEDKPDDNLNAMNKADESFEEAHFRKYTFYVILDNVIGGLTVRFSSTKQISDIFSFLWNYQRMSKEKLKCKKGKLAEKYSKDKILNKR